MTCKHCTHDEASLSYLAQYDVFTDTLLGEAPGFNTLVQESEALLASNVWRSLVGPVPITVEPMRSPDLAGRATAGRIVQFSQTAERCVVPHEFAHIFHQRHYSDAGHGPAWRSTFVTLTEVMYGSHYAKLLADSFRDHGLDGQYTIMRNGERPLVDIDRIAGVSRGGWRR